MRHVLFIQGGGGQAFEADAKLAQSLREHLGSGYDVRYPQMPNEEEPNYATWKRIIFDQAREMGEGAILVGHSIGASVLIKALTEPQPKPPIAGAFLIAPPFWHDHEVWHWDEVTLSDNAAAHFPPDTPLVFFHGEDDETVPLTHLDMYLRIFPSATAHRLPGRNHQLNDDLSEVARAISNIG